MERNPEHERLRRLNFTQEEQVEPNLKEPGVQTKRVINQQNSAKARFSKQNTAPHKRTVKADTGKKTVRLQFEDTQTKKPSKLRHVAADVPGEQIHRQISKTEDENVGVQAAHESERAVERTYRAGNNITRARKLRANRTHARVDRATSKTPPANASLLSRIRQRKAIKRQYAAAKAGRSAVGNTATAKSAGKAVQTATDQAKKLIAVVIKGKKGWLVFGALGLLLVMLFNGLASCGEVGVGALNAVLGTSFVSEDRDLLQVEAHYVSLETGLERSIDRIESDYPGHDEYNYEIDEIGHDPYSLMSYLTAKYVSFTLADVRNELAMLFDRQYSLSVVETVEIRYETERQLVSVYDDETGEESLVWKDVEVPYEYKILDVTLLNRGLAYAMGSNLNTEQAEMYAVLLESYGNKPDLFSSADNPYIGTLDITPPEPYEIPPEALFDPDFAALIEEANKYLGYPYVWGGSKPSTGFDCSGFVCWVLNHSGVASVGRTNARGLYKRSTVVSKGEAQPGDLIFFTGARAAEIGHPVTHVGIVRPERMIVEVDERRER
jgi:hypothetical protein